MDVQRSKYLTVDPNVMDNQKFVENSIGLKSEYSSKTKSSKGANKSQLVNTLSIKYCIPREVD